MTIYLSILPHAFEQQQKKSILTPSELSILFLIVWILAKDLTIKNNRKFYR